MADKNNINSFDHFFQKKTKEYDIPFHEADWLRLEKKLDLREAQRAYRKKVGWIAAAAILIVSMLGYFTYENHIRLNQISQQIQNEAGIPAEQHPLQAPILPDDLNSNPSDERTQTDEYAEDLSEEDFDNTHSTEPDVRDNDNRGNEDIAGNNLAAHSEVDGVSWIDQPGFDEIRVAEISSSFVSQVMSLTPEPTITARDADMAKQIPVVMSELKIAALENETVSPNRFTLGVIAGPDLSSVGTVTNFHQPGYKIGLMLEYRISSALSVSAGAVQSKVRYSTHSQSYSPPAYWADGNTPTEMAGECLLIDIPINLKYNVYNLDNSRFFITAGISSYIMMNEEYTFRYDGYNSESIRNWSGRTGSRHLVSNAGFSIGYELDVHRNWSLRAEPFIKTPIREVGWSNVRLFSTGSFFSLNYRL